MTCQSVKGFCTTSHAFLQFLLRIIRYDDIDYQENSGSIAKSLDANIRNTTPVKMTGSTILQMCQPSFSDHFRDRR